MDNRRFDAFTRTLSSRRSALGAGLAGTLGALLGLAQPEDAAAHNFLARCRKIKNGPRRRACLRRARAHNRTHRPPSAPPPPPPPRQPNAACDAGENGSVTADPPVRFAQTFTEPNGGRLVQVELYFARANASADGSYLLQVNTVDQAGLPTNITIGTAQEVPASTVSQNQDLVYFNFYPAPLLGAGQQYALVLSRVGSTTGATKVVTESPGPCPGGAFYISAFGGVFYAPSEADAYYRTVVSP